MDKQQKYEEQIRAILEEQPQIMLNQCVRKCLDAEILINEIDKRLDQLQEVRKGEQEGSEEKYPQKLNQLKASQLQVKELVEIVNKIAEVTKNEEDKDDNNDKQQIVKKTESKIIDSTNQQQQNYEFQNEFDEQPAKEEQQRSRANLQSGKKSQNPQKSQNSKQKSSAKNQKKWHEAPSKPQKDNTPHNDFFTFQPQEQQQPESPQLMPNFQNYEQLQQLAIDQKQHRNLFDARQFQVLESPRRINKSQSFYSKKYQALKDKLKRYLVVAFYQYVNQCQSQKNSFFDKQEVFKKPFMDLTLFLRFYKDFDLKELLKVNEITKFFKKQAINHLLLDVEKFLSLAYCIVEIKTIQNSKQPVQVINEEQLIDRTNRFIALFDKQRLKKYLKLVNKDALNKIFQEYTKRQQPQHQVQKTYENKPQVVGKFLERNFQLQVPKWYQKKDLHRQNAVKSRVKSSKNLDLIKLKKMKDSSSEKKKRDENTISSSIQKLRSQSQKNIVMLKNLLDGNDDLKTPIAEKQGQTDKQGPKSQQPDDFKTKKSPLHKNKHKNIASVYKQLQNYINQNFKAMKSQKNILSKQLKLNDDEPFLNAFFSKQLKKTDLKPLDRKHSISVEKLGRIVKNPENIIQKKKNGELPLIKDASSRKVVSLQATPNYAIQKRYNQQMLNQQHLDDLRKNNSRSEPSKKRKSSENNMIKKRIQSMKKLGSKKSSGFVSSSEEELAVLPIDKKSLNQKLSQKQKQLINKKLYDFLMMNREQQSPVVPINKRNSIKPNQSNMQAKMPPKSVKPDLSLLNGLQNLSPTNISLSRVLKNQSFANQNENGPIKNQLMRNHRQEVYQLFKNCNFRDKDEDKIVSQQNLKRRGHINNKKV